MEFGTMLTDSSGLQASVMGTEEIKKEFDADIWYAELAYDQWVKVPVSGPRPLARYKHAAVVVDEMFYIAGGSRTGRHLSDVQVFDFRNMVWSTLKLFRNTDDKSNSLQEIIPPISDHHMIKWGTKLFLVGGNFKKNSDNFTVRFIDLETQSCGVVETTGNVPVCRGGHSVTLLGSRLFIFGGEDRNRRLLNDIHALDLDTMVWHVVETRLKPPAPRFDHTAAIHAGRYFLIFCGCSHSFFFNDLHVLDLQTMEWSQPQLQCDFITPRAGQAGVTIGDRWYIVGGGDNKSGTPETLLLDMSKLSCSVLASVKDRDPLASEGLSVCSMSINSQNYLVAFGGYNGKYSNEVYIMRLKLPDSQPPPKIFKSPAAAAAAASVTGAYAVAKPEVSDFNFAKKSKLEGPKNSASGKALSDEISSLRQTIKELESNLFGARAENSKLKAKSNELNATRAELSKELESVQCQLAAERSRCSKFEKQISEMQERLGSLGSVEKEVEFLRRQKWSLEDNKVGGALERKSSSGVLQWMYGGGNS